MPDDKITPPTKFTINDTKTAPRGRPPGSRNKTTPPTSQKSATPTADVRQALATLESAYKMVALGLVMTGMHETATEWANRTEALKETNADALASAPKLAKMIAGAGTTGGTAAFIFAHVMALGSVVAVGRAELMAKAVDKPQREPRRTETGDIPGAPLPDSGDPTLIPGLPIPGQSNVGKNG